MRRAIRNRNVKCKPEYGSKWKKNYGRYFKCNKKNKKYFKRILFVVNIIAMGRKIIINIKTITVFFTSDMLRIFGNPITNK